MLRWTAAGAVSEPNAVQLRIAPRFPGRVRAGAPTPPRALTLEEVNDNVRWFVKDRVGPRTAACTDVVLSGVLEAERVAREVAGWRELGVKRAVWHLGEGDYIASLGEAVDVVVCTCRTAESARALVRLPRPVQVVLPLTASVLPVLAETAAALADVKAERVVLHWPYPGDGVVPPAARDLAPAVRKAVQDLESAGHKVGVKGLPPCVLSPTTRVDHWADRAWRTRNRWYVDSAHQRERALVFFPDLARFVKPDSCRFCAVSRRCDGVLEPWLAMGLCGALSPMHTG